MQDLGIIGKSDPVGSTARVTCNSGVEQTEHPGTELGMDAVEHPDYSRCDVVASGELRVLFRQGSHGTYVARTAIHDARLVQITEENVSFRWKNRDAGRVDICTLPGGEFVRCYLRHVLPRSLRSIRYYGFCHPAAKAKRLHVQCHAGGRVQLGNTTPVPPPPMGSPLCPCCRRPMTFLRRIRSPCSPPGPVALFTQVAKA